MKEAACIIDFDGKPCSWHLPDGRTVASLPDSYDHWRAIFDNRHHIMGVAHWHPGGGVPSPSYEDITTFSAVERGVGRRLMWWILSDDYTVVLWYRGPERLQYKCVQVDDPDWAKALRAAARDEPNREENACQTTTAPTS